MVAPLSFSMGLLSRLGGSGSVCAEVLLGRDLVQKVDRKCVDW